MSGTFLIEANAGTGKTHAIQELYRRLVMERGLMPSEILVVTFTNAATAELAGRIRQNLADKGGAGDARLRLARSGFDLAAIHTIHAFCMGVLNGHAFECGLPYNAEPLADTTPLVREITADFHRRATARGPVPLAFHELLDAACLFARFPNAKPVPGHIPPGADAGLRALREKLHALPAYARAPRIKAAYDALRNAGDDDFESLAGILRDDLLRDAPTLPQAHREFQKDLFLLLEKPRLALLLALHADFTRQFEERKRRRNLLAYDDQLSKVAAALEKPGSLLPSILRAQYRAVFIDEFQDTDPVQCGIFKTLFHDHALLFLIGDPKQAIYGFRGADLNAYLDARDSLGAPCVFSLLENHRSAPPIIHAVNRVFSPPGAFHNKKIIYEPSTAPEKKRELQLLHDNAPETNPFRRVLFYDPENPFDGKTRLHALIPRETAAQITRLLNDPSRGFLVQKPGAPPCRRPVLPSDIAVLTRTHAQSLAVRGALLAAGVPAVIPRAESVFASAEAREFHLFLETLQNPRGLKPLLASRWCGFDDAALLDDDAVARAAARFNDVREAWHASGPAAAAGLFLDIFDTRARLSQGPSPERALTNLRHLVELAVERQRGAAPSLDGLLRWFAECIANPPRDESHEQRLESDGDAVRILTIHKSKGLTFPVVFCPWLKFGEMKNTLHTARDAGGGTIIPLSAAARLAHPGEPRAEGDARLVYVALTRAAHLCVAFAVWPKKEPPPATPETPAPCDWLCHFAPGDTSTTILRQADLAPPPPYTPRAGVPGLLHPESLPPPIPKNAGVLSYSALKPHARGGHVSQPAEWDGDPAGFDETDGAPPLDPDPDVLPRGNTTGNLLHKLLETFDFPLIHSRVETAAAISGVLENTPLAGAAMRQRAGEILRNLLQGWAFQSPETTTLSAIPFADTRREMRFTLNLSKPLDLRRLRSHGIHLDTRFHNPGGYITGIVDLLFRVNGRYHFMDWKSDSIASFDNLPGLMAERGYRFQLVLYATALHRVLQRSLGASYDPARHFGGGYCVFLRHLSPRNPNAFFKLAPTPGELEDWRDIFA